METGNLLKKMENLAQENSLPIIGSEKGEVLFNLVLQYQPQRILEVGTLIGYSAILMAQNLPAEGEIVTLEIDPLMAKLARENFRQAGLEGKISLILGDARQALPFVEGEFDLLFLDAVKEDYFDYLRLAEPRLSQNAIVVADNVKMFAPEIADYREYIEKSGNYQSIICDFDYDAVEVSFRK